MKKLMRVSVLAGVVLFVLASVAPAATIVEKNGFTYKIKGDLQIQYRKDVGIDQDLDVEYDDLEIKNYISYDLGDGMKAFGGLDFGFKNAADKPEGDEGDEDVELEEAYLGMVFQNFSITVGKTNSAADEFGIEGSYETPVIEDAFEGVGFEDGDDLIRLDVEIDNLMLAAAHEVSAESEKSDNGEFTDIFVGAKFSNLDAGAAYQTRKEEEGGERYEIYGLSLAYDAEVAYVAADFSSGEDDVLGDFKTFNLFVSVPVANSTEIGAGYVLVDLDDPYYLNEDQIHGWYANATYKFPQAKKFKVFAEISGSDEKDEDTGEEYDTGFLVGAQLKF